MYEKFIKNKPLLKMSLLNFNFVVIYIIHKMLVLLKNNLKDNIFEWFFKEDKRLFFWLFFFHNI